LVKNGATRGQKQARWRACGRSSALNPGTASVELDAPPALFETATRALAEENALRAPGRIGPIDTATAWARLHRAAVHGRLVRLARWHNRPLTACQRDALGRFVHTKEHTLLPAQRVCETYGAAWMWSACAPVWRLVVAFVVGKRPPARANLLLERVAPVTDDRIPFCTSDQLAESRPTLRPG
jgi:hypothetical protein